MKNSLIIGNDEEVRTCLKMLFWHYYGETVRNQSCSIKPHPWLEPNILNAAEIYYCLLAVFSE
jgi:hypothetical protein